MSDVSTSFVSPAKGSTITSISTTVPSASHHKLQRHTRPSSPSPYAQPLPTAPSAKSPFFISLEEEHDASRISVRTDSPSSHLPHRTFQTSPLSSASTLTPLSTAQRVARQPRRPLSTPPSLSSASRAASHSVSVSAWRQWSKHSANYSDCDSIISEPASYSNSARVSSDIWIVQGDVHDGERTPRQRQRQRQRHRHPRATREFDSATLRRSALKTRVTPAAYDAYDDEADSSKLLSQFMSGSISPTLAPNNKRGMSEFDECANGASCKKETSRSIRGSSHAYYASSRFQQHQQYASYKHVNMHSFYRNESYVQKKRFAPRRIRWWLRKWTQKMRGQWEYNF
ncbi:unnamed protein product [Agarophyton chilense]|eukprot:gb/GEZJ01006001.1/.p1 GENE.gb/GEZJ01006001.1/~~gb/GEZJ01006001.1/.p1  ORF type:complete len:358 (-),score=42.19 gb/GEZJ01006001.1/:263-1288(-)